MLSYYSAWGRTQDLTHTRQALYHGATSSPTFHKDKHADTLSSPQASSLPTHGCLGFTGDDCFPFVGMRSMFASEKSIHSSF